MNSPVGASFHLALSAAQAAAGGQHYPEGCLYVVATPIGNLADITLRALTVLERADTVACEDTRHTAALLTQYGLHKPLLALHQHNEAEASQAVVARLQAGERVAYVSDAGTPAISDPGARLVRAVRDAGWRVMPVPGASSVTTLLCAAGIEPTPADPTATGFAFIGFLPSKPKERERAVQALATESRSIVILEAPHRIQETASALSFLSNRLITVGRELTKQFEEVATVSCADLPSWLTARPQRCKGEFALVLHPLHQTGHTGDGLPPEALHTLHLLLAELPVKTAVRLATDITRQPKNTLYEAALAWKAAQPDTD
ncbi:MAG TPA: 16S rRNA (cytidine(1402)-2'-O)-methyltransferase [Burkholderiaceae bacterium]|nr:16S rRNA (cytidine(1402)-2'-O)-methyltransferase [Burkholderiaceae bacterium]